MKCPFRTITTTAKAETVLRDEEVTRVEFGECYETECPFYGRKAEKFNDCTMRRETVLLPACRRAQE